MLNDLELNKKRNKKFLKNINIVNHIINKNK